MSGLRRAPLLNAVASDYIVRGLIVRCEIDPSFVTTHKNSNSVPENTVQRVRRREPSWNLVVIGAVPVPDPSAPPIAPETRIASFVIFTKQPSH